MIQEIDREWGGTWRWRPRHPVTIYLYADANRMADDAGSILGSPLSAEARSRLISEEGGSFSDAKGGWAVLMVVKGSSWGVPWEQSKARHKPINEYAHVMIADPGARNLPVWFAEGVAEYLAFARDPQAISGFGRVTAATALFNISPHQAADPATFPSLRTLNQAYWDCMVRTDEGTKRSAYGIGYVAVKYLIDKVGPDRVAQVV